ncbi:FG-GAP-like repeat-containing protein [Streptomyces coeruleorubidus]|uniref:FG-GAP-like repeat-containing protein n=1 Tax=Streptomyces coeruleorubidus TaxID=116188 RepID=UPI00237F0A48|nr:FG-GAP-like repeat-containing protein [Streptomyces coeruleorubidus]WDV53307.1 FG-GAP-like repeat-containing protein [Streptomyces coeruleorubidus]
MRKRTLLLAATLTTGLLTITPAAAAPSGLAGDFNGDGYRDVAVGAPCSDVGSASCAGAVVVLYGSSSGVSATRKAIITQNSPGVPGTAESTDLFGSALAAADLDRDGYSDLVVGATGESIGDRDGVGSGTVLWGGTSGLSGGKGLPQPSTLSEWGGFSHGIATGDFDGDGDTDVTLTGQSHIRVYLGPFTRTGGPLSHYRAGELGGGYEVIAGDMTGDSAAERVHPHAVDGDSGGQIWYYRWTGTGYKFAELPNADGFPGSVGDINGDGYGDLVLGDSTDPSSHKPGGHKGGQITVWYGGPNGPDPAQTPTVVHQDTTGVPGAGETDDAFGSAVSTGDINGDGYADVAVAAHGEDLGTVAEAGSVTVLFGSASGLRTSGATSYTQDTSGVPGTAEAWDRFGSAVDLTDLTKDGKADLVIGVDGENGSGGVWTLRGTSTGLSTTGAKGLTAAGVSLKAGNGFGSVIAQ